MDDGPASGDHEATWLMGHTERITFLSDLWEDDGDLYVAAELNIPCAFLSQEGGVSACSAWGYQSTRVGLGAPRKRGTRRIGPDRFRLVESGHLVSRTIAAPAPVARSLPVFANPCATAPCRTADHTRGAACCRDLQVEIMCTTRERRLEALLRARKSPYLCKISREGAFSLNAEMISACGFLLDDAIHCSLHGRTRADGRPAKPDLCSHWPEGAELTHPGCAFG